jgi:hypothetical protein
LEELATASCAAPVDVDRSILWDPIRDALVVPGSVLGCRCGQAGKRVALACDREAACGAAREGGILTPGARKLKQTALLMLSWPIDADCAARDRAAACTHAALDAARAPV